MESAGAGLEGAKHRLLVLADDDGRLDGVRLIGYKPFETASLGKTTAIHTTDLSAKLFSDALAACAFMLWNHRRNE